mmetsp:Transcript_6739/g.16594  ORF Transcript_6739/g.16594 Transcript_6739/m.16594 type:complete len:882 (+) Transcript_6739:190-2835(+)
MRSLASARAQLRESLGDAFDWWGRFVAGRPLLVVLASFVVLFGCCLGLLRFEEEARSAYLWAPTSEKAYIDWKYTEATFGEKNHGLLMYAYRTDGGNIFKMDSMKELLRAHLWTTEEAQIKGADGSTIKWEHVCERYANAEEGVDGCSSSNFLTLWDYDMDKLKDAGNGFNPSILDMVSLFHQSASIRTFAGTPVLKNNEVKSAKAVMLLYRLNGVDGDAYEFEAAWNDGIESAVDNSTLKIAHFSQRSYDEETARLVSDDVPLFAAGINVIWIYLAFTLGPITSAVRSRPLLAGMSVVNVGLAIGAGFGICSLAGVKFVSIASLLALILLGVEVDGIIIFVDSLNAEPVTDPFVERIGRATRTAGPAILLTSITAVAAFGVGITTDLPAVSMFCAYAAASFSFALFVMFTFFLGLLVLDERRLQAGRLSIFPFLVASKVGCDKEPCCGPPQRKSSTTSPQNNTDIPAVPPSGSAMESTQQSKAQPATSHAKTSLVQRIIRNYYAPFILSPPVSACIVIIFAAIAALSGAFVDRMEVGLPDSSVLPDDSYIQEALRVENTLFDGRILTVDTVLIDQDWNSEEERTEARVGLKRVEKLDFVHWVDGGWYTAYTDYKSSGGEFTDDLRAFLAKKKGSPFEGSVNCTSSSGECVPRAVRHTSVYSKGNGTSIELLARRATMEEALSSGGAENVYVYVLDYLFAETDTVIWELTLTNMGVALLAILVLMLIFAPPIIAMWITVCVALIDLDLLGIMVALGVPLNTVSFVNLVMAIGLSVDYCVHVAHAFDHEWEHIAGTQRPDGQLASPRDAVAKALETMGGSVVKGGFTTFIGICVVAFASSVAFRTFFTLIAFTVIFGMAHGLIFMPVILAYASVPRGCAGKR